MKVLFVSRAKGAGLSPIVESQGISLIRNGIDLSYYRVEKSGFYGYLAEVLRLRKYLKKHSYDIVHAHYSFCGVIALLSFKGPVICSLMGSDVKTGSLFWRKVIKILVMKGWATTIVKSEDMKNALDFQDIRVIPNGVDLSLFAPMNSKVCRERIDWPIDKRMVVFAADPSRNEKNFILAEEAVKKLNRTDVMLQVVNNIQNKDIPYYLNAADVLILTSLWEGSPNVVKEAMACNVKVVAVAVGDIPWLLEGLQHCYITSHDAIEIADKIQLALELDGLTNGRDRLYKLGLDSLSVVSKITDVYRYALNKKYKRC